MDSANLAHYQTDYTTKGGPLAGALGVLQAQSIGLEFLRQQQAAEEEEAAAAEDEDRTAERRSPWAAVIESARRTVIRLTTSANKALLKKLPEMVFQMQFGHDCYCSHDTWTVFTKGLVALAYQASKAVKEGRGDEWGDAHAGDIEVEPPGADGGSDDGGGDVMAALNEALTSASLPLAGMVKPNSRGTLNGVPTLSFWTRHAAAGCVSANAYVTKSSLSNRSGLP